MSTTVTVANIAAAFPGIRLETEQYLTTQAIEDKINEAYTHVEILAKQTGYDLTTLSPVQQAIVDLMVTLRTVESYVRSIGAQDINGRNPWASRLARMTEAIEALFTGCQLFPLWNAPGDVPLVSFVTANEANNFTIFEPLDNSASDLAETDAQRWVDYFCALVYAVVFGVGYPAPAIFSSLSNLEQGFYRETVKSLAAVLIGSSRAAQWRSGELAGPDNNMEKRLKDGLGNLGKIVKQEMNLV